MGGGPAGGEEGVLGLLSGEAPELVDGGLYLRAVERASADFRKRETSVWRKATPSEGASREPPRSPQEPLRKNDQLQASARAEKTDLVLLASKQDFLCPYSPALPLLTVKPRA